MENLVADRAILIDIYPRRIAGRTQMELWFKTYEAEGFEAPRSSVYIEIIDRNIPVGPRTNALNYMYANRLQQFGTTVIYENNGNYFFHNYGVARPEFLSKNLKFAAQDSEVYNPKRFPKALLAQYPVMTLVTKIGDEVIAPAGKDEEYVFMQTADAIESLNPDVIFGWNSDGFDFTTFDGRIELLSKQNPAMQMTRCWGRDGREFEKISQRARFTDDETTKKPKQRAWRVPGRAYVDLLHFANWYLKGFDNRLTTVAKMYGIELVHHEQEEFYKLYEKNDLNPIVEHCKADVEKTYNVGLEIFPALVMLSQMTYAPLWMISRARPAAMDELIADKALLDIGYQLSDLPTKDHTIKKQLRDKMRKREFLTSEQKMEHDGLHQEVEIQDLGLEYILAAKEMSSVGKQQTAAIDALQKTGAILEKTFEDIRFLQSKYHRRSAYFMIYQLGRSLRDLVVDPYSSYYRKDVGQEYTRKVAQRIADLKEDFSSTIVLLNENHLATRFPPSADKIFIAENGFWGKQSGIYTRKLVGKRIEPPFHQSAKKTIISKILDGNPQASLERYLKGKRAIEENQIDPKLLAVRMEVKTRKQTERQTSLAWIDQVLNDLKKTHPDIQPREIVYAFKTKSGWVDLSRGPPASTDVKYYSDLFEETCRSFKPIMTLTQTLQSSSVLDRFLQH